MVSIWNIGISEFFELSDVSYWVRTLLKIKMWKLKRKSYADCKRDKQILKHVAESGRSMVEMIGVLSIVGLLSIGSVAGLRIAINKIRANAIIHDGRLVFTENITKNQKIEQNTWVSGTYGTESGKQFWMMQDMKKNNYVKVADVENKICELMLKMQKPGDLAFFRVDNYEPFVLCEEEGNQMLMAFDGLGRPVECETTAHCQHGDEAYNGYCDNVGHCIACDGEMSQANLAGDGCTCIGSAHVCSDDGGHTWCCGNNMLCGVMIGQCLDSTETSRKSVLEALRDLIRKLLAALTP